MINVAAVVQREEKCANIPLFRENALTEQTFNRYRCAQLVVGAVKYENGCEWEEGWYSMSQTREFSTVDTRLHILFELVTSLNEYCDPLKS